MYSLRPLVSGEIDLEALSRLVEESTGRVVRSIDIVGRGMHDYIKFKCFPG